MSSDGSHHYEAMTLPTGTVLHTVVGADWVTPQAGHPNEGPARFSPIVSGDGSVVTTIYAGPTAKCALGETVFRDLCGGAPVNQKRIDGRAMLLTKTTRELTLADMRPLKARAAGPDFFDEGLGTTIGHWPAPQYGRSAALGSGIYRDSRITWDGICWESRQAPPEDAFLIFTDRATLTLVSGPEPLTSPTWLGEMGALANELRVILPTSLLS